MPWDELSPLDFRGHRRCHTYYSSWLIGSVGAYQTRHRPILTHEDSETCRYPGYREAAAGGRRLPLTTIRCGQFEHASNFVATK
mmetsp:Transcript_16000/g.48577  ORF Transcript_16000/g.48577 Transcript_16000/m.48577 type:complete len:84 (+) Transcript_16000:1834-2085(+)